MKNLLARLLFVVLSAATIVFFSEKAYWYIQGYALAELVLFYAFPVFACLWTIERFRVGGLAPLVLVSALFAFLVEGVITPVIYEAGLLDPIMPAYFIGWHGLLSIVFGWYLIRMWLVRGHWQRILAGAAAFGVFWGTWSLTFWLPENRNDPDILAQVAETAVPAGQWPVSDFALYAFTFTGILMLAHWLMGRSGWQPAFRPGRIEIDLVFGALGLYFVVNILWANPLALLKLAALLGILFLGLWRSRRAVASILENLEGPVRSAHVFGLLIMPLAATSVYALAAALPIADTFIRSWLSEGITVAQTLMGGALFVWAFFTVLRTAGATPEPADSSLTADEVVVHKRIVS